MCVCVGGGRYVCVLLCVLLCVCVCVCVLLVCCVLCALRCVCVGAAPTLRRAIKIGGSAVRYDVAREVFLIRATTLEDVEESKELIGSKMAVHGFQLEIAGAAAASTPPAHSAPTPTLLPKTGGRTSSVPLSSSSTPTSHLTGTPTWAGHTSHADGTTTGYTPKRVMEASRVQPVEMGSEAVSFNASPSVTHPRLISRPSPAPPILPCALREAPPAEATPATYKEAAPATYMEAAPATYIWFQGPPMLPHQCPLLPTRAHTRTTRSHIHTHIGYTNGCLYMCVGLRVHGQGGARGHSSDDQGGR